MKILLQVITICLSFTLARAQLTLLNSEMLPFGAVMTEKSVMDLSVIDTTIQGTGVTWNFSTLTNNTSVSDLVVTIVNPVATPYAASFPNSNYGYKEVKGTTTNYRYFSLTSTKMERVGSYVSNVNSYNDPQVEYVFPLAYGTVNNDTWDNTNSSTGGNYNLKCIGTGTLKLPGGSYNALMVRVHCIESFLDFYVYFWYSSDNGAILLTNIKGDGLFVGNSATYLSSLTIDIKENNFITDLSYNNPVENNLNLSFQTADNGIYNYTVINSLGQKVNEGNSEIVAQNTNTLDIDFSSYPAGIYFFSIRSEKSDQADKTIRIIKK